VGQEEAQELVVREIVSRRLSQRQPRKELAAIARRKPSSAAPQAELDERGGGESDRGGDRGVRGGATVCLDVPAPDRFVIFVDEDTGVEASRVRDVPKAIEALEGLAYDECGNVLLSCEWRCEVLSL
jgi:hypothetical protein